MITTIDQDIRDAAYKIIESKRSTYYGIGHVVAKIVEALLYKTASIFPVCSLTAGEYGLHDVVIGLPSLVNGNGVRILDHYPLSPAEQKQLQASAEVIKKATASIDTGF